MKLKALLVDFDGTLVDSAKPLFATYKKFLKLQGSKGSSHEFKSLMGPTLAEVVATLKKNHHLTKSQEALYQAYTHLLKQMYEVLVQPMSEAIPVLLYLKKQGVKLVLVSSANRALISLFLARRGLQDLFDHIVTGDDVKRGKPDPMIYQLALKKAKVAPQASLALEDSINGVQSALNAHINVWKLNSRAKKIDLKKQGWQVRNWDDIKILLSQL